MEGFFGQIESPSFRILKAVTSEKVNWSLKSEVFLKSRLDNKQCVCGIFKGECVNKWTERNSHPRSYAAFYFVKIRFCLFLRITEEKDGK